MDKAVELEPSWCYSSSPIPYSIYSLNDTLPANNKFNKQNMNQSLEKISLLFKNKLNAHYINYITAVLEDVSTVIFTVKMSCMKLL